MDSVLIIYPLKSDFPLDSVIRPVNNWALRAKLLVSDFTLCYFKLV